LVLEILVAVFIFGFSHILVNTDIGFNQNMAETDIGIDHTEC